MPDWTSLWQGRAQWRILQTGFGAGLAFLGAWRAWKDDPGRPGLLHYVGVDGAPCPPAALVQNGAAGPALSRLAEELAPQWRGLLPGFHRLAFEDGRVLLTLCVGDLRTALRELEFRADCVVLSGAQATELDRLKAIARLSRRGTLLAGTNAAFPRDADLRQCGFVRAADRSASELRAIFAPAWEEQRRPVPPPAVAGRCAVIGGGLAGAAVAASLARRGWQVEVLDAASEPAAGASSLPAGLLVAHQSPDDSLLSRLSRAGVRMTLAQAAGLLREGVDWAATGVLAHRPDAAAALPARPPPELDVWSRVATPELKEQAGLAAASPALWHEQAGWIRPAALVRAWLAHTGVRWRGGTPVAGIAARAGGWCLQDRAGDELAEAELVVIAAAHASASLLPVPLPLQPVRGQVTLSGAEGAGPLPPFAVSGNGHFLPRVPLAGGTTWVCGATFDRDDTDLAVRPQDHAGNLARLERLLPGVAARLTPLFASGAVRAWTGVRCASADRRPLVGELAPGLWVSTAMGSRGLTFAHLCAELIAARLHSEPLPLPRKQAAALDVLRRRRPD